MLGGQLSKRAGEFSCNNAKYYLSGVLIPLTEGPKLLSGAQRCAVLPERDIMTAGHALSFVVLQQAGGKTDAGRINTGRMTFWLLLVLALLVLAGYLLFQIRRRQATNARVRVLQQDLGVLFDHAPCGYHSTDKDGTFININETLLMWLGYEKHEVLHKMKFTDIVIGDPAETAEKIESILRLRFGKTDVTLAKKNGEHLPVILGYVHTEGGKPSKGERLFSTIDNKRCNDALERIKNLDQELEAFSYSISHDLRAPLRSIDGYSRILQEDYAEKLDEEGKRVLGIVMNNAKRMGKLIDDLLDFGRLGRRAIHYSKVNMTGIVQSIVSELKGQEPTRNISVQVDELMPALGDADMLRQVWYNLLENAVKYTGKNENASIVIHSYTTDQNELCYEVKDNGVGFDMQYADKLFGIFQRLHKMQDFSGTGVGLAIVKRIITRHGGRVWANGSLKGGATFYFTLPTEDESN